jgi:hypothetical protein
MITFSKLVFYFIVGVYVYVSKELIESAIDTILTGYPWGGSVALVLASLLILFVGNWLYSLYDDGLN